MHIQKCIDIMGEEGFKVSTIKMFASKINYILNQAVEPNKIILTNPIGRIKYPSETLAEQTGRVKALTNAETEHLLSELKKRNTGSYLVCLMVDTTGVRIGELLGITWTDMDFQNSTLNINKQWKLLKNGEKGFGKPPKK